MTEGLGLLLENGLISVQLHLSRKLPGLEQLFGEQLFEHVLGGNLPHKFQAVVPVIFELSEVVAFELDVVDDQLIQ